MKSFFLCLSTLWLVSLTRRRFHSAEEWRGGVGGCGGGTCSRERSGQRDRGQGTGDRWGRWKEPLCCRRTGGAEQKATCTSIRSKAWSRTKHETGSVGGKQPGSPCNSSSAISNLHSPPKSQTGIWSPPQKCQATFNPLQRCVLGFFTCYGDYWLVTLRICRNEMISCCDWRYRPLEYLVLLMGSRWKPARVQGKGEVFPFD